MNVSYWLFVESEICYTNNESCPKQYSIQFILEYVYHTHLLTTSPWVNWYPVKFDIFMHFTTDGRPFCHYAPVTSTVLLHYNGNSYQCLAELHSGLTAHGCHDVCLFFPKEVKLQACLQNIWGKSRQTRKKEKCPGKEKERMKERNLRDNRRTLTKKERRIQRQPRTLKEQKKKCPSETTEDPWKLKDLT